MILTDLHNDLSKLETQKSVIEKILLSPQYYSPGQLKVYRKARKMLNHRIKEITKLIKQWPFTL